MLVIIVADDFAARFGIEFLFMEQSAILSDGSRCSAEFFSSFSFVCAFADDVHTLCECYRVLVTSSLIPLNGAPFGVRIQSVDAMNSIWPSQRGGGGGRGRGRREERLLLMLGTPLAATHFCMWRRNQLNGYFICNANNNSFQLKSIDFIALLRVGTRTHLPCRAARRATTVSVYLIYSAVTYEILE